jgi:Na+-driven multidrug efflux pump
MSFMPGFGFAVASMTLVGQYLGKGMPHRAIQYAWLTNKIAFWSMAVMGGIIFLFAKPLTAFFIDDPQVVYWGSLCVMIAVLEQPTLALCFVLGGALRGAGDTRWPMYVTTIGVWLIRLPLVYLFITVWDCDIIAAWYITAGDFLFRSVILWRRFASQKWL